MWEHSGGMHLLRAPLSYKFDTLLGVTSFTGLLGQRARQASRCTSSVNDVETQLSGVAICPGYGGTELHQQGGQATARGPHAVPG